MGRKKRSKLAFCVLIRGHRLLFLILDPVALPEPNRRDADKRVLCPLFLTQPVSWSPWVGSSKNVYYFMANYYCEYCGQKFSSVQTLTLNSCPRHPNGSCKGKHKLYEGPEQSKYICEYCGQEFTSLNTLTLNSCPRHPNGSCKGKHKPFIGGVKSKYTCKYCGQQFSSLTTLTLNSCPRHPDGSCKGKHSPAM